MGAKDEIDLTESPADRAVDAAEEEAEEAPVDEAATLNAADTPEAEAKSSMSAC